ncbi:MAG: VanW family protein, partial [Candidatus Paceibacterota bacterium]
MNFRFKNLEEKLLGIILGIVTITVPVYYTDINFSTTTQKALSISAIPELLIPKKAETEPSPVPVLLGRAEVGYAGGIQNRNSNIKLGVAKIDGTRVAPGEEFSFLNTLGPVLIENGFKEANSFLDGEVVLGLGGGLCHVSTTLFQSILQAGLPVTERHSHTFVVPFYKPGLDATISNLGPDLKFRNDTGH